MKGWEFFNKLLIVIFVEFTNLEISEMKDMLAIALSLALASIAIMGLFI